MTIHAMETATVRRKVASMDGSWCNAVVWMDSSRWMAMPISMTWTPSMNHNENETFADIRDEYSDRSVDVEHENP